MADHTLNENTPAPTDSTSTAVDAEQTLSLIHI